MAQEDPRQGKAAQPRRAYRLEMDGWVLQGLVGLLLATGVAVFYLGYLTGKGARAPIGPPQASTPAEIPPALDAAALQPGKLSINQALSPTLGKSPAADQAARKTAAQTQKLLKAGRQVLAEPTAPARAKPPAAPAAGVQKPRPPRNRAAGRPSRALYTVQVFSSQKRTQAQEVARRLQNMRFEVYLNQYQSEQGQVWHRVRVGRLQTQAQAQTLSRQLQQRAGLKDTQILRL